MALLGELQGVQRARRGQLCGVGDVDGGEAVTVEPDRIRVRGGLGLLRRIQVVRAVRALAVVVVAAAGLPAMAAGRDRSRLDRMGLPARLVEALLPERLRHLEVDVD